MDAHNGSQAHTESRFKAFVSYSHADKAAAQRLHRKLETYRLPKHLRGEARGTSDDGRVGPIFRDREDLPAAEDLSESVKVALSESEALVVLCSPDARKSPWVAREIELFRELHPGRPVLAAILRGEPEEAFPEPLKQGREPLAADLRKEGDGPRLGFLKIVAGIAGVPLDSLVNRDAQRQIKRVTAITVAAVAAMVVMALMTAFAIQQRNEAQFQRNEADGLISYMMTDLRDELEGVGRLDVMQGVNRRALRYYTNQGDLTGLPSESLAQRSTILLAMGEDNERLGNLEAALDEFTEAHRVTEELLRREPSNPERIYAHAQSEFWVGFAAWRKIEPKIARSHWQSYSDLSLSLLLIDEQNVDWIMEAGYAKSNLGMVIMRGDGDFPAAVTLFYDALEYFEQVESLSPDNADIRREIADAHGWIADAHRVNGAFDQALKHRAQEREILQSLAASDPQSAVYKSDLIGNAIGTARSSMDSGDIADATATLLETQIKVRELAKTFPRNEKLQFQERLVALLLVKADNGMGAASRITLRSCSSDELIQSEIELKAFCDLLRSRIGRGRSAEEQSFGSQFPNMKLTPRWGINLIVN